MGLISDNPTQNQKLFKVAFLFSLNNVGYKKIDNSPFSNLALPAF